MFIFPLLFILTIGRGSGVSDAALADFSRFANVINQQIALVDLDGTVREGIVAAVTDDQVSVRFGAGTKTFARGSIASAERMRDGRRDGAIKGAIFGTVIGLLTAQAYRESGADAGAVWVSSVVIYSGIGYALDAAQTHREPIYRSPAAPAPTPKPALSMSFWF